MIPALLPQAIRCALGRASEASPAAIFFNRSDLSEDDWPARELLCAPLITPDDDLLYFDASRGVYVEPPPRGDLVPFMRARAYADRYLADEPIRGMDTLNVWIDEDVPALVHEWDHWKAAR